MFILFNIHWRIPPVWFQHHFDFTTLVSTSPLILQPDRTTLSFSNMHLSSICLNFCATQSFGGWHGLLVGKAVSLTLIGYRDNSKIVIANADVIVVEWVPKEGSQGESQLPPVFPGGSPRSSSRFDPGFFQTAACARTQREADKGLLCSDLSRSSWLWNSMAHYFMCLND